MEEKTDNFYSESKKILNVTNGLRKEIFKNSETEISSKTRVHQVKIRNHGPWSDHGWLFFIKRGIFLKRF